MPQPTTIYEFFEIFYSTYIFPNNLLEPVILQFITAITTMLFFIWLFKSIASIFGLGGKKK